MRRVVAGLALALVGPLSLVAVLAHWVHGVVLDTDTYVETVAPLARDDAVLDEAAVRITRGVVSSVELESIARDRLPPILADRAAGPLTREVEALATERVRSLLGTERFQEVWDRGQRLAHEQLVTVLTGSSRLVDREGTIGVDLRPAALDVQAQLAALGLPTRPIPEGSLVYELGRVEELPVAQRAVEWLDRLAVVALPAALLAGFAAVALAARPRRMLVRVGIVVAGAGVLVVLGLLVVRTTVLDLLVDDSVVAADRAVELLVRDLRSSGWALVVVGALLVGAGLVPWERVTRPR